MERTEVVERRHVIRLYTDRSHYRREHRRHLVHLLRPVWDGEEAADTSGAPSFRIVPEPDRAHVAVLPMTWNYYVEQGLQHAAHALAAEARGAGKQLLVFAAGDREPLVPIDNAVVLHPGPNRTNGQTKARALALPSFIPDVRALYFDGKPTYREKQELPVVGFCGHGASPTHKLVLSVVRGIADNALFRIGRLPVVPGPVMPPVLLRARILRALHASPLIDDRFIIRQDYRAGVRDTAAKADPHHPTRLEFVRALDDCDYTLCIRGGGNFSLRLYETLALGRIPIFVDTDSVLPYDFLLDWRQYCCWIGEHEIDRAPEIVAGFHAAMSPRQFIEQQRACRWLWEEWMSTEGYQRHFVEYLKHVGAVGAAEFEGAAETPGSMEPERDSVEADQAT
jgi:hypothetical protein